MFQYEREKDFLVCVDSDGCAFNNMEYKHIHCFAPIFVDVWKLEPIRDYAEKVWNEVNLYSATRGINRFLALIKTIEVLKQDKNIEFEYLKDVDITNLKRWAETTDALSEQSLQQQLEKSYDMQLEKALEWSRLVNQDVAKKAGHLKPFEGAISALQAISKVADIVVVSAASNKFISKEWEEHNIRQYVKHIAGQEDGNKTICIQKAMTKNYPQSNIIMIGDAGGDYKSAQQAGVFFYPIIPGKGDESWGKFENEILEKFIQNRYDQKVQNQVLEPFRKYISE